jgi:acyl carrier protein
MEEESGYGPTESTTFACCYLVPQDIESTSSISIGRPIGNTTLYVSDKHLALVPGELYIGGVGLARGYHQQPALTAERFIPHPFSTQAGSRLYKTGDIVRYRQDGFLEFIGRYDDQVKLRGFRIEPGEIEAVLQEHFAVQEAIVLVQSSGTIGKQIVAYIVPHPSGILDCKNIETYAKARLPQYMVPSAFVFLDELPLTSNGKLNRNALPMSRVDDISEQQVMVEPRSSTEKILSNIYMQVLNLKIVNTSKSFFEMGGHSLQAIQIISRINEAFALSFSLSNLFTAPSLAALATLIEEEIFMQQDSEALKEMLALVGDISEGEMQDEWMEE